MADNWFSDLTNLFKANPFLGTDFRALMAGERTVNDIVIEVVEASGRFDRSPDTLHNAMLRYSRSGSLILGTEAENNERRRALQIPGHGVVNLPGGRGNGENFIVYNRQLWDAQNPSVITLSSKPIDVWPWGIKATVADMVYRPTGFRMKTGVCHFAARIESPMGWRESEPENVASMKEAITNLGRLVKRWNANYDGVLFAGDFNLDWRKLWVREYLNNHLEPLRCNWTGRIPNVGGTHAGGRLIDMIWSTLRCSGTQLMRDDASSDHRPISARYVLKKK